MIWDECSTLVSWVVADNLLDKAFAVLLIYILPRYSF